MGDRTYSDFKTDVLFELGNRNDTDISATWLGRVVNDAYIELACSRELYGAKGRVYFPELEQGDTSQTVNTTDTNTLTIPYNAMVIRHVRDDTSDYVLKRVSQTEMWKKWGNSGTGAPKYWYRDDTVIRIQPDADDTYSMRILFKARPDALSDNTDTTAIGSEWDEIILQLAVIKAHYRLREFPEANAKVPIVQQMIRNIAGIYNEEQRANDDRILPSSTFTDKEYYGR
jgi:hypothetical protein